MFEDKFNLKLLNIVKFFILIFLIFISYDFFYNFYLD